MPRVMTCPDVENQWVALTWQITHWLSACLSQPLIVVVLLVTGVVAAGALPKGWKRRSLRSVSGGLLVVYLLLLFPPAVTLAETALTRPLPNYGGQSADAVVLLGRGSELSQTRVAVATQLWEDRKAPLIFASGITDAPAMVNMLQSHGIPAQALEGEDCSRTTYQNAKFTAQMLKPQGVRRILLVTDAPHLLRSTLTFQAVGFTVIPISSSDLLELDAEHRSSLVLREYLGLISYGLMGRFSSSHSLAHQSGSSTPAAQQPLVN